MDNENLLNKKVKYEEIKNKLTNKYYENMESIQKIIEVIEANSTIEKEDKFETIVFKKYLELENVKKVADHINILGYRIKTNSHVGQRKYTSNDISELIASDIKDLNVEENLRDVVKEMHKQHSIAIAKRFN